MKAPGAKADNDADNSHDYQQLAHAPKIRLNSARTLTMYHGSLYLIPNVIAEGTQQQVIPAHVRESLMNIRHFLAEDVRTARRYLSSLGLFASIEELTFEVLKKDTDPGIMKSLFTPVFEGNNLGVISDAGCPGIADPGAIAVRFAHDHGIRVVPLVGPSSLLLASVLYGVSIKICV